MSGLAFVAAVARLAVLVCPVPLAARYGRRLLTGIRGVDGALLDVVGSLAVIVVAAELLGLFGALRLGWLAGLLWMIAAGMVSWARAHSVSTTPSGPRPASKLAPCSTRGEASSRVGRWCLVVLVGVVVAQWGLQTADSLGGGMFSFDVLWYHMPFAAAFAQSGSVTHIQFTQADPFVAYYPATSELVHGLGIMALGNDFLSPLLNLGWMTLALLAGWSVGQRWGAQRQTLSIVAMLLALPVFSTTQPGQAFSDVVGLAGLLTAVALLAGEDAEQLRLLAAGAALGLAVGTKYTFVVPTLVLIVGVALMSHQRRARRALLVAVPAVVTGGWWYLRAAIHTGNPFGIRSTIGPITLPGPRSPLAEASQQTVISQLSHAGLWSSRFAPGLAHSLGVLWPILLIAWLAAVVIALVWLRDGFVRTLAVAACLSAIAYLVLPTGATAITQTSQLFAVNLRYLLPALALGLILLPVILQVRAPGLIRWVIPSTLLIAIVAQLEPNLWPTQTARHVAFLFVTLIVLAAATLGFANSDRLRLNRPQSLVVLPFLMVSLGAAAFIAQHHYFRLRYRDGHGATPGLGAIYGWAQTVGHTPIGLYGTVQQYPFYGRNGDNHVTYLGQRTPDGGYRPIDTCRGWQQAVHDGRYRYLVLTPAPTAPIPLNWSRRDASLTPILHPSPDEWVFQITPNAFKPTC